jgi:uncharacterized protein (TIGR03000 family)
MAHRPFGVFVGLSVVILFVADCPVHAQLMSKWGHPVFTIGSTPYDSTNTGHGNYPAGPGLIPGYGYYPGAGPGTYPWMDGPGTPFDRRKLINATPAVEEERGPDETALIIVKLPAEAELWFDDAKTRPTGSYRRFISPPLPGGCNLSYTLRAQWRIRGVELTRTEKVFVAPNGRFTIDFLTADNWTPVGKETLSAPRKAVAVP